MNDGKNCENPLIPTLTLNRHLCKISGLGELAGFPNFDYDQNLPQTRTIGLRMHTQTLSSHVPWAYKPEDAGPQSLWSHGSIHQALAAALPVWMDGVP